MLAIRGKHVTNQGPSETLNESSSFDIPLKHAPHSTLDPRITHNMLKPANFEAFKLKSINEY